jgi:membrane-bound lytic murein transglycosylase A
MNNTNFQVFRQKYAPGSFIKKIPMNILRSSALMALLLVSGILFHNYGADEPVLPANCLELPDKDFSPIKDNGKLKEAPLLEKDFSRASWEEVGFPVITPAVAKALRHQLQVIKKNLKSGQHPKNSKLGASYAEMKEVIELLLAREGTKPDDLFQYLDPWQSKGGDRHGNIYFTGYYTPAVKVKKVKDNMYKYPIYAYPADWKGALPSRRDIDGVGALAGRGLELAYAADPFDIYLMQLQGSATVIFTDTGERMLFRYAGENGHAYRNIQNFFRTRKHLGLNDLTISNIRRYVASHPHMRDSILFYNPSYTFFATESGKVRGAGEVPLLEGISIAADPRYFPMGSVLLAAVPVIDEDRNVMHHDYKILLPQDVGGAVRGGGHVDLYCGKGDYGREKAASIHHYGRIWVLLPKDISNEVAMAE